MNINDKTQVKKIYRGGFQYSHGQNVYGEEEFEVYKDTKLKELAFLSNMHSRTPTGELLQIKTYYEINKNHVPTTVDIIKSLGEKKASEHYNFDSQNSALEYKFVGKKITTEHSMNTNQKYHITVPTCLTSTLFLSTKKFDTTSTNEFFFVVSNNQWIFRGPPQVQSVFAKRLSESSENLTLNKNIVQTIKYELLNFDESKLTKPVNDENKEGPIPKVEISLSSHISIPYIVKYGDITIRIKQLNFMDE